MGKTFRRDNKFRPKKHGRVFTKEEPQPWKKKHQDRWPSEPTLPPDDSDKQPLDPNY